MSPDDIFAAQFWPWPDPAIKRDNQGRVLFVNAAFLQLYGGTVQDWTGNVIGGWPTPQGPGQPYRFETRMPMTTEMGEQVYDWIEMTLADGNAFALARNVTFFLQPADPQPSVEMPAQMDMTAQVNAVDQNYAADAYAPEDVTAHIAAEAPSLEQPVYDVPDVNVPELYNTTAEMQNMAQAEPVSAEPVFEQTPQAASHEPVVFAEYTPEPDVLAQAPEGIAVPPVAQTLAPAVQAAAPLVEASVIPNEVDSAPERAYERRALPIENESAVLGNNWRDAVIAKAVGADIPPAAQEVAPAAIEDDQVQGPKRILLAEDNAINALLTRTLLEAEGHTVETVQDGQLAVEAMKTSAYDLIFMDMRMPNMDGLEATRKIRTLPNVRKDLPIIALTANAFDDDRNACFDSGMNDFMTKPVSAEELSEMVLQWTTPKEERMAS